jgi:hypothetical protein
VELSLNRLEIRRRMNARLGNTTNTAQAPQNQEQHNAFIDAAAEAVYMRCPWQRTMRETFVDVGIDQRFVNYPTSAGPGNIQSIGLWDETAMAYRTLRRGIIPVTLDDEPLVTIGEPDSVPGRGQPELYELKAQIELWRRPDQEYQLKIDHTVHTSFADDTTASIVDAESIILLAMADAYDFQGDTELARTQRRKFEERLRQLMSSQHPLTTIKRGRFDRLADRHRTGTSGYRPDSGAWPSVMPS